MYRAFYTFIFYLALPAILVRLVLRSFAAPGYRRRIPERLGYYRLPEGFDPTRTTIWIHAVSVGETQAAEPLVQALRARYPDSQIHITTMTPTGSERVKALFGDSVSHSYVPYDVPGAIRRFLDAVQPALLILMETELWPNLIHYTHERGVRLLLANGRLSDKSAAGYARFPDASRHILRAFDLVAAQAKPDARRFISLGAQSDRVAVTGSLKFNVRIDLVAVASDPLLSAIKESGRTVIVAASTREGEEVHVLAAFRQCLVNEPDCLLVLIPRHPERFDAVARLCAEQGYEVLRRSAGQALLPDTQIVLGDSMGEMGAWYEVADVAFVGGSLVNTGCQNVLEPAARGLPVFVGPSQFNFAVICRQLEDAGALATVADSQALGKALIDVLAHPAKKQAMGAAGRELVAANQDALPNLMILVQRLLD